MNIRRKGAGIAFSAALLASLVATVAAPAAFASVTVTSAGTIPINGTSSGTASFTFTENAAACFNLIALPAAGPELQVVITDSGGFSRVHFVGTPTVGAPGSLGATATLATTGTTNDTLQVNFAGSDNLNIEAVTISGLAISADGGSPGPAATTGGVIATLTGNERGCVIPGGVSPGDVGTATATGTINAGIGAGSTVVVIDKTSTCNFAVTGAPVGNLNFLTVVENKAVGVASAVGVPGPGQQTLTIAATASAHAAAEPVNQTVVNCNPSSITSPGTVAAALTASNPTGSPTVLPGQNNNPAGSVMVSDTPNGTNTLLAGQTLTFTITSPATGVVFSVAPPVTYGPDAAGPATCALSVDRKTCSVSGITDPAALAGSVTIGPTTLDVDSTVPLGTVVKVTVTTSPSVAVTGSPVTIAFVGRIIVASAPQPVVYIGFNDQATGLLSFTESGPGFFTAGPGANNTFGLCPATGEFFTRAPWAVVVTGDLKLLSGVVGVSQVKGTLAPGTGPNAGKTCAYWTVFSASTVASTVELRGSADDANPLATGPDAGPRINVPAALLPGSVQWFLNTGNLIAVLSNGTGVGSIGGFSQLVSNGIRAFKNNVTVTAASQPRCQKGSTDCLAGNIVITETQNGQLRMGEVITVNILPRATTQRMDTLLQTTSTNQTPIVTTNAQASGLLVTPVGVTCTPSAIFGVVVCSFAVTVTQQSFGPTFGTITFSNIHYVVAADAVDGPVLVNVTGAGGGAQTLDAVVSNAIIGALGLTSIQSSIAVGVTKATCGTNAAGCAFRATTAVTSSGTPGRHAYNTVRFQVTGTNNSGVVDVYWVHAPDNQALPQGYPGSYVKISSIPIGAGGWAFYFADAKVLSANGTLRASFIGVVRSTASYGSSRSKAVSGRWL